MEGVLHYIWQHRIFPAAELHTTDGRLLEIIDVGIHNRNQGPDFFNAKIRLDGILWAGNVEIHSDASEWFKHGHDKDCAYDNTILHVVEHDDAVVVTSAGSTPAQFVLRIPERIRERCEELSATIDYPRCHRLVRRMEQIKVHAWMDALLVERLAERSKKVLERLSQFGGDWEKTTFVTLSRAFGFGLNGDTFEVWAGSIPLQAVGKHRDNLIQVAAFFLGMAGLIERSTKTKETPELTQEALMREWTFLSTKFQLSTPMQATSWRHMRIRPRNFPEVRIVHLARLFHAGCVTLSRILDLQDTETLFTDFRSCGISEDACRLLVINAVVPLLYAYGRYHADETLCDRALSFLDGLPAEDNYILRQWRACGLSADTAADSQALMQLKREYCDLRKCMSCRFGHEFLSIRE